MRPFDLDLRLTSTPLTTAEKVAVCPVADVKAQARVTRSDEDDLIESYVEAAYDFLSGPHGWLNGACLLQESWEWFAPSTAVGRYFELPLRPLAAIASFSWVRSDGSYSA